MFRCFGRRKVSDGRDVVTLHSATLKTLNIGTSKAVKLAAAWRIVDLRKQGAVHAQRFWRGLEVPSSDFLVKLVRFGDVDADALQFGDFVVLLWLLAAIRDKALVDVCVELYDTDSDGLVTLTEVQRMVRDLHGDAVAADERVSSLLANLDKAANGLFDEAAVKKMVEEKGEVVLNADQLLTLSKRFPVLLQPLLFAQNRAAAVIPHPVKYWSKAGRKMLQRFTANSSASWAALVQHIVQPSADTAGATPSAVSVVGAGGEAGGADVDISEAMDSPSPMRFSRTVQNSPVTAGRRPLPRSRSLNSGAYRSEESLYRSDWMKRPRQKAAPTMLSPEQRRRHLERQSTLSNPVQDAKDLVHAHNPKESGRNRTLRKYASKGMLANARAEEFQHHLVAIQAQLGHGLTSAIDPLAASRAAVSRAS